MFASDEDLSGYKDAPEIESLEALDPTSLLSDTDLANLKSMFERLDLALSEEVNTLLDLDQKLDIFENEVENEQ